MTDCNSPSTTDRDEQSASGPTAHSRRGVLQATGAAIAGAGLSSVAGSATGAGVTIAPLTRDGNRIVDPTGNAVTLRGVNIAEPGEQSRDWRGMDADAVLDMATAHPDWSNVVVRVPIQPAFVGAGAGAASGPAPSDLSHGDEWGPALPGTFDAATLDAYLDAVVDPLVDRAESNGCYLMLVYDRHFPVYHQEQYESYLEDGQPVHDPAYDDLADVWDCSADGSVDHTAHPELSEDFEALPTRDRHPDVCGERGVLWHGADQREAILDYVEDLELWEYFEGSPRGSFEDLDDVYLESEAVCHALDAEVRQFWEVVADRYADSDAVVFDVYNEPTGPYAADWGGPEREAGGMLLGVPEQGQFELWGDIAREFYDLWVERSQPWMDVAEDFGQGQLQTIGNPRWSQYVYWAPYNEYDTENVCYSAHVQLQQSCRPLQKTVGCASEHVPIFFSDFGWMDHELYVPTPWLHLTGTDGIEWATGETDPADERLPDDRGESLSFGQFFDEYDVHPICSTFDHTHRPNFFDHGTPGEDGTGARGSDHWYDDGHLLEEATPGEWWRGFVDERDIEIEVGGGRYYAGAETGPSDLHGTTDGYAYPTGEHPSPGGCGPTESRSPCEEAGAADSVTLDDGQTVCDLDGDGSYRDVNGDGSVTNSDVTDFFSNQHTPAWNDEVELFDFDGDDSVGQSDVVDLFQHVN